MAKEKKQSQSDIENTKVVGFDSYQEEEAPKRKSPRLLFLVLIFVIVAGLVGLGVYLVLGHQTYYNDYELLSKSQSTDAARMTFAAYNDSLIKYSQEGITYLDKDGQAIWVESYKMKQPVAVVSGKYVAVADFNGNEVYVFNENGRVNSMVTPYTICDIDVASQGVFAVVLENETENYIEVYDKNGQNIADLRITIAQSGYPMDITLSDDGTKMMTSFITVNGVTVENTIAAYNFGDVGQNVTDRLVGGFNNLGDTIVPKIEFLTNDLVCAFGDNKFIIYNMREIPSEKTVITDFSGEIQSIFYNSKYVGIVERGNSALAEETGDTTLSPYVMQVYNASGNTVFSKPLEFAYTSIYASEDEIIVVGSTECRIYDFNGKLKFSYSFAKEIKKLVPTGNPLQYIVVFDDETEMIKLQYVEEEES